MNTLGKARRLRAVRRGFKFYANNSQKCWGPNHNGASWCVPEDVTIPVLMKKRDGWRCRGF